MLKKGVKKMKKILITIIILVTTCTASAVLQGSLITFQPIEKGQPGSFENPLKPSEIIDIYITINNPFFVMDILVGIEAGNARIITATGIDEATDFGWEPECSNNPIITDRLVELGLAVFTDPKLQGTAAKVSIQAISEGVVTVGMGDGFFFEKSVDAYFKPPIVMGELTIYQTHLPEPATVLLFAIGMLPAIIRRSKL